MSMKCIVLTIVSLRPAGTLTDTFILLLRSCSRDPTRAIADRLREMYEIYSQHFQPDENVSNCAKGKVDLF